MFIAKLLVLLGKKKRPCVCKNEIREFNIMDNKVSLEQIKDMIIEAYTQVDPFQREQTLAKVDNLEQQLVRTYQSRGLKLTASNIAHTLDVHKKSQKKRSL